MNILVVGGGGYLGVPLVNELAKNHSVSVYDTFKHNSQSYFVDDVRIIEDDVKNLSNYKNELKVYDVIYYLASPRLHELTDEIYEESLAQFKNAIDLLSKFNCRIIYISSCSVYGNKGGTVDESSETQITSLYSKLKIACETELFSKTKYNHLIVRLSTLYGNSNVERKDIFINNLIDDILKTKHIEIYDPAAIRPHLHVQDAAIVLTKLLTSNVTSGIINIGNNDLNISKEQLVKLLEEVGVEFTSVFNYTNDSRSYQVDFSKLQKHIEHNFIDFKTGILELL